MSTATLLPPPPVAPPRLAAVVAAPEPGAAYRWTVAEYEHLVDLGVFSRGDRVELLEGEIVHKEMPKPEHAAPVDELNEFFGGVNAGRWRVRCQQAVRLPDQDSEPEPDLALVRRRPEGYRTQHPGPADIFLLIEVANTSVALDRGRKLALYAQAAVAEYWVVNVGERVVEVYREPDPAAGTYRRTEAVRPGGTVAPAAFPDAAFAVAELFGEEG